jgi:hypothetical protein
MSDSALSRTSIGELLNDTNLTAHNYTLNFFVQIPAGLDQPISKAIYRPLYTVQDIQLNNSIQQGICKLFCTYTHIIYTILNTRKNIKYQTQISISALILWLGKAAQNGCTGNIVS